MFENNVFAKTAGLFTLISFSVSVIPLPVRANNLVPVSFSQMYNLAQNGEVEALRASVRRGMNINTVNRYGDTGLCVAAKRKDAYTYNAFRAAGANPRHPCVQNIDDYDEFVSSSHAVSVTATPREAYSSLGKEEFKITPTTWWLIGGLALGGGITALALSGGGGGGGSSSEDSYDSVANNLSSLASVKKSTSGTALNTDNFTVSNTDTATVAGYNFNENVLETAKYLYTGLMSTGGGSYTNYAGTEISVGDGAVGMAAVDNSFAYNNGYIKVDSFNASIGMIASGESKAFNVGSGTNGIDLVFKGYDEDNTIIGMYADTKSTITNNGEIEGTAQSAISDPTAEDDSTDDSTTDDSTTDDSTTEETEATSSGTGSIIGMEVMIINTGSSVSSDTASAINNGSIKLSAGDGGANTDEIKVNLIGMGSYLDDDFLNGSSNIRRAENAYLENNGTISLSYTGIYTTEAENTLRKGLGGVVGMRVDANSTGVNNYQITITLDDYTSSSDSSTSSESRDVAAGMQSVHGGTITNDANGVITITTTGTNNRVNYGMLAVEGSGNVSGLYANATPVVTNEGAIYIAASNSYGMASYNGGTLTNDGLIVLGTEGNTYYTANVGMYGSSDSTLVSLVNEGTISVYSTSSTAMKNDYSGSTTLTNDGTIHVYSTAVDSNVFGGNYSAVINNGTIIFESYSSSTNTSSTSSSGGDNWADSVTISIVQNVMNTLSPDDESSTSSTTETATNGSTGVIRVTSAGTAALTVGTSQGNAYNYGYIYLLSSSTDNNTGNVGMYLSADTLLNTSITNDSSGTIYVYTKYSAGMASDSEVVSSVVNNGVINVYGDYSFGLYASGNSYLYNNGTINLYGDNTIAIYSKGEGTGANSPVIENTLIKVYGDNAIAFQISGEAVLKEVGTISICSTDEEGCSSTAANTLTYFYVIGSLTLEGMSKNLSEGTFIKVADGGEITIDSNSTLSISSSGSIVEASGSGSVYNYGTMTLYSSSSSYAISSDSGTIINSGTINLSGSGSGNYGISTETGTVTNSSTINVGTNSSYGIYASDAATISTSGNITVSGSQSYGIYDTGGSTITSSGTIAVTGNYSYGIYSSGTVTNSATINVSGSNSYGIYSSGTVTNNGTMTVSGSGSYGIYAASGSQVTNNASMTVSGSGSYGIYAANGSQVTNNGSTTIYAEDNANVTDNTATTSTSSVITVLSNSTFKNAGTLITNTSLDFDNSADDTSIISVAKNGSYQATSFSGTVTADADITYGGYDTVYTNENSFVGTDNGLNIVSGSYLFTADKQQNADGNTDVVMTMKSFDDVVANSDLASYLSSNYAAEKGETTFDILKSMSTESSFNQALNREFGFSMIPNLAKQDLSVLNNINRVANDDILQKTDETERAVVNVVAYEQETDGKQASSGYKDKVAAVYGFSDYQIAPRWRAGFGAAAARADSDFDDDSSRYNNMLEVFAPLSYVNDNFRAMVKPKVGFGDGHYRRQATASVHKADLTNYYYGVDMEARQTFETEVVEVEPVVGFNVTGVTVDDIKENNDGLKVNDDKIVSAQSVLGLDVKKEFELAKEQSVLLTAGGRWYHEFGNKYRTQATLGEMLGSYELVSNRLQRNSGLLSLKAQYNYKRLAVSAAINAPLEQKSNVYYMFNLGYKF